MTILNSHTKLVATVKRNAANALRVELADASGQPMGEARQKSGLGVLLGFKNGGRSTYNLAADNRTLTIDVAGTTTVSEGGTEIGKLVPHDGGARFDDPSGAVLGYLRPHVGHKAGEPWCHPILAPQGESLGTLTLFATSSSAALREYLDQIADQVILDWNVNYASLRLPALGSALDLQQPVSGRLGDLLACACVDSCVLPRGYTA
ncbi:hypothetical protein BOO86_04800 [Mycobacterium sp. CBMA 234]|uniref:hypothetical protein n=1 Tax=Mycolicibacterium sp. CBMA 234 TaxID=1918495 RepID=UPI0012DF1739|nr:hypothetical protein [Mycolicibacterium sp. CBMA 234]MUL63775.1 hypothetical protein [Mycolicibacterium sp. CBMA 234]